MGLLFPKPSIMAWMVSKHTCQAVSRGYSQAFGACLLRLCCTGCSINSHHQLCRPWCVPGWRPSCEWWHPHLFPSFWPAPRLQGPWTPNLMCTGSTPTTDWLSSGYTCLQFQTVLKQVNSRMKGGQSSWLQIFSLVLIKAQVECYSAFQSCFIFFPCIHSTWHPTASLPRCTPTTKLIFSAEPLVPLWLSELSFCL